MLKKTITYTDYDGNPVQEDFYFHLTKAELVELEAGTKEGFVELLKRIVAEGDNQKIIENFKLIILMSIGKRSEDGKRFIKNQEIRDEFSQTEAYSELFIELATQMDSAVEFINGVIPKGLSQEVAEANPGIIEGEVVVTKDPTTMTHEELLQAFQQKLGETP